MVFDFSPAEEPQTLIQYNKDLEEGDVEIERGDFSTVDDLKTCHVLKKVDTFLD